MMPCDMCSVKAHRMLTFQNVWQERRGTRGGAGVRTDAAVRCRQVCVCFRRSLLPCAQASLGICTGLFWHMYASLLPYVQVSFDACARYANLCRPLLPYK